MAKFKVGDRVRIIHSGYLGHSSRMAGGVGTVAHVGDNFLEIDPDGDPKGVRWSFNSDELAAVDADESSRSAISILVAIGLITQAQADAAQALAEAN